MVKRTFPGHFLLWHQGCRGRWAARSSGLSCQLDQLLDRNTVNNQPPKLVCSGSAGAADLWHRGGGRRGGGGTDCPPRAVFWRACEAHLGGGVSPGEAASPLPSNQSDCMLMNDSDREVPPTGVYLSSRRTRETTLELFLVPHGDFSKSVLVPKTSS